MDVFYSDGKPLSESDLMAQLLTIVSNTDPLEEPVGILTSTDRTSWAHERNTMEKGND
jgi:hypothetical protein